MRGPIETAGPVRKRTVPRKVITAGFLLAVGLLLWPGAAGAFEEPVARVVWTAGEAEWRPAEGGDWRPLTRQLLLSPGTELRTGPTGRAELVYQGEAARLWIEPETLVTLGETYRAAVMASTAQNVRLPGDLPPFRAALVRMGAVWAEVRHALSRLWRFEVETPTAVAGVRGTRFRVRVTPSGETRLYVAQGVVELRSLSRRVLVPAGRVANVRDGGTAPSTGPGVRERAPDEWDDDLWEGDENEADDFLNEGEASEPEFVSELEDLLEESEDDRHQWLMSLQPLLADELARDPDLLERLIEEVQEADDAERSGLLAWLLSLEAGGPPSHHPGPPSDGGARRDDQLEEDEEEGTGDLSGPGRPEEEEEDAGADDDERAGRDEGAHESESRQGGPPRDEAGAGEEESPEVKDEPEELDESEDEPDDEEDPED